MHPLGRRDVHVWWFDGLSPVDLDGLTEDEQIRAVRYSAPDDRARFVLGRRRLRAVCARYTDAAVWHDTGGRPRVEGDKLFVSASHSGPLAVIAVARRPVGVDVERRTGAPLDPELVLRFLPSWTLRRPSAAVELAFLNRWVRVEALAKALGTGLELGLRARRLQWRPHAQGLRRRGLWHVRQVAAPDGYSAAIATRGLACRVIAIQGE
ncbi:MAG: 4'-phosphopantetheinyl transferase family protein [Gaiellaceae bacterium]